jgi:Zn-dependent protease with chaperone function
LNASGLLPIIVGYRRQNVHMKILLLLIAAAPLFSQVTDFSNPSTGAHASATDAVAATATASGRSARLNVSPMRNGDVDIDIEGSEVPPAFVAQITRGVMGCKWRELEHDDDFISGVCEKWLHGDATYKEGSIELFPLVIALRAAGASEVRIALWASSPPPTLPRGWRKEAVKSKGFFSAKTEFFTFRSASPDYLDMPPAFPVSEGERWKASRLAAPLLLVMFGPLLLALWLRRRGNRQGTGKASSMWLSWILNGAFLYWLTAVHPVDIAGLLGQLHLGNGLLTVLAGVILYAAPPLSSMASCLWILGSTGATSSAATGRLLRLALAQQAALIVPLGLFMSANGTLEGAATLICLPAAYVLYRVISWYGARLQFGGLQVVADGELTARMAAIAQTAGAKLRGVYVLRNRLAEEVNAFASSQGVIILTHGLVERLPRRELDAVIAHEAGHLRGKHIGIQSTVFWAIILFQVPAMALLHSVVSLPDWFPMALLFPVIYTLIVAQVSQRHEFDADLQAARITRDPEAVIAALARLSRIKNSPLDWGGIQGSILTHPSMKKRVLAVAQSSGMTAERALALLANPDLLATYETAPSETNPGETAPGAVPVSAYYPLPAEFHSAEPVFNSAAVQSYAFWASWGTNVALVALLVAAAMAAQWFLWPGRAVLVFLSFIPAAAWAYLRIANSADRQFYRVLRNRIAQRLPHSKDAIFVGLLPGNRVQMVAGLYQWDMGFLSFTPGWMTYGGERTRFSISRGAVSTIAVQAGPAAWDRNYAVVVTHDGGAFVLGRPDAGYSRRKARKLQTKLNAWLSGEPLPNSLPQTAEPLSPPNLPALTPYAPARWKLASAHMKRAGMLFMGTSLLVAAGQGFLAPHSLTSKVVLAAPMAYLLAMVPKWLRSSEA